MTEIKIPDYWTPEQATAVFEFIDEVREAIIIRYRLQIMEQLHSERCTETESIELFDEKDIPF
ncbi:MAG: hypothetical protein KAJ63_16625 [Methyloprofundus sp.]|nr:hypothetical protein [Methyloprofundus sp.]